MSHYQKIMKQLTNKTIELKYLIEHESHTELLRRRYQAIKDGIEKSIEIIDKIFNETSNKLNKLADYLEFEVKEEKFNMKRWITSKNGNLDECGTTACALGWATVIWEELKFKELNSMIALDVRGCYIITYGEHHNYNAAIHFFKITENDAYRLFDHRYYDDASKKAVVNRLREVANKYKETLNA